MGRPRKINQRSTRILVRCLNKCRHENVNVTVSSLVMKSGLSLQLASRRTFSRHLNALGYGYLQARKKGLVTEKDRQRRQSYAKKPKRLCLNRNPKFWSNEVSFYLDGVSFVHKHNPFNSATTPKSRVWRKKSEGLAITAKGSKDLAGGRRLHVIVAIAYGKAVVLRVPYEKMNGQFFAVYKRAFPSLFCTGRPKTCSPSFVHNGQRSFANK